MRQTIDHLTSLVLKFILPATAFLVPLFFLPVTTDFFTTNKQLVLAVIASLSLLAWTLRSVTRKRVRFTVAPSILTAAALALIFFISSLFQTPNTIMALVGETSTILALVVILITTTSSLNKMENIRLTLYSLLLSVTLSSVVVIYQYLGVAQSLTDIPWLDNKVFNPVGGPLPFLTVSLPLIPAALFLALKTTKSVAKLLLFVSSTLLLISSIMAGSLLMPVDGVPQLVLLPLSAGWAIAVEIFKNVRSALLGTGPESYMTVFTQLKPLYLNADKYLWATRFSTSSNTFLTLLTTTGLLGAAFYIFTLVRPLVVHAKVKNADIAAKAARISLALAILVQLLVPTNIVLTTVTFILIALLVIDLKSAGFAHDVVISFFAAKVVKSNTASEEMTKEPSTKGTEVLPWVALALAVIAIGISGYIRGRAYASELAFYNSLVAANANDGTKTYNDQIQAIQLNPYNSSYRISYSQTNLALANAIAAQGNLSDQDRQNITTLIQQSIREAKVATEVDPFNAVAWQNLASVYRQMINLAEGADQWSVAAYTRAIQMDPANPQLRLELGGIYYSLGDYATAIRHFEQAINLKQDWANAYYNLAAAYRESKQYPQALQAMRVVSQLVDPTSEDYQKAQDDVAAIEKLIPSPTPTPTGQQTQAGQQAQAPQDQQLVTPTPLPSPTISPIQLPDNAGLNLPSEEEINPSQQPQSPTPTQ